MAAIFTCGCIKVEGQQSNSETEVLAGFSLQIAELSATSARITVVPDKQSEHYYTDVLTAEYYNAYTQYGLQRFVDATIQSIMTTSNSDKQQALQSMLSAGTATHEFTSLEPESSYCAIALYITTEGQIIGDVGTLHFTTPKIE